MELRVTPGQAATAAVAVCSINTNFNWKTIQLTKSVKRVGRLESASLRVSESGAHYQSHSTLDSTKPKPDPT